MHVILQTNRGNITFRLHMRASPKTAENFVKLARSRFYDGTAFHRVIDKFVIQGGCPRGDGTGGPGYTIDMESNDRKHERGTVAMARGRALDSAGSQFYIARSRLPHLDGEDCIFGSVTAGIEVVDKIEEKDVIERVLIVDA